MNHSTLGLFAPSAPRIRQQPFSTDGTDERLWLLRRLRTHGPQVTTVQYANNFIFPDIALIEWCNFNNVKVEIYHLTLSLRRIPFIRFILQIPTDEDRIHDWYEQLKANHRISNR